MPSFFLHSRFSIGLAVLVPLAAGILAVRSGAATSGSQGSNGTFEEGEQWPGGSATSRQSVDNRDAFSHHSHGIGFEGEMNFRIGNSVFRRLWVSAPSSTTASDGLGPLYNARGCQNCHLKDGRGRPPEANWPDDTAVSFLLKLAIPPETDEHKQLLREKKATFIGDPVYGKQLQNVAIQGHAAEGQPHITYTGVAVELADGQVVTLRRPDYSVTHLGYGPMHPDVRLSPRVAPQMIGLGLIAAIPEADIRAGADPDDADGDGISGRVNEVWSLTEQRVTLGRFGWKAGVASVRDQTGIAAAQDIGLSNPLVPAPSGDCTDAQKLCLEAPHGNSEHTGGVELGGELFDLVVFYSENLAVPSRRDPKDPTVLKGKGLFHEVGCAACHRPSFTTGEVDGQPHLSNQTIWPYSDFLIHDMGEGLADGWPEGDASGREWRTAPLWGIGLTETVVGHTFLLHDGRARNVEEAILWHGGEAERARDGYAALSPDERAALLAFVNSL